MLIVDIMQPLLWICQEIFLGKSTKISFAFFHACITIRSEFVVTFRSQAYTQVAEKCASKGDVEFRSKCRI